MKARQQNLPSTNVRFSANLDFWVCAKPFIILHIVQLEKLVGVAQNLKNLA